MPGPMSAPNGAKLLTLSAEHRKDVLSGKARTGKTQLTKLRKEGK